MTESVTENLKELNYILVMLTDLLNLHRRKKIRLQTTVDYFDEIMKVALGQQDTARASRILGNLMKNLNEKPKFFIAEKKIDSSSNQ